jgi:hypothetical protein
MAPAQERFDAGEAPGGKVNRGLIDQKVLTPLERALQTQLKVPVVVDGLLHRSGKDHGTTLTRSLGAVEGSVGVLEDFPGCRPAALSNSNAGGDLQRNFASGDLEWGGQYVENSISYYT